MVQHFLMVRKQFIGYCNTALPNSKEGIYGCSYNGYTRAVSSNTTQQIWKPEACVWEGKGNFAVKGG